MYGKCSLLNNIDKNLIRRHHRLYYQWRHMRFLLIFLRRRHFRALKRIERKPTYCTTLPTTLVSYWMPTEKRDSVIMETLKWYGDANLKWYVNANLKWYVDANVRFISSTYSTHIKLSGSFQVHTVLISDSPVQF